MRDDDELRARLELVQHAHEAANVRVVEGRVDLVEQAEGAWLGEKDAEQERQGDERPLATRQEVDTLGAFSARRGVNLDVTIERRLGILEPQIALAAAKERQKYLSKVLADLGERREKELARRRVDFPYRLLERLFRFSQVGALRR